MVAVVTDSVANVPADLAGQLGIHVVPMHLELGSRQYRDGVDLVPGDFYERIARNGEVARTSAPSPGDFLAAYERTGQREVVCVTVAAAVSATHHEARLAGEPFDGTVVVVDSGSASMGEGFVALAAARAARAGASLGRTAAVARQVAREVRLVATIDTFEFLRRSGRVGALQAYAATMLSIKPVFSLVRGEITPTARPRTRRRALDRIVAEVVGEAAGRPVRVAAFHANAADEAGGVLERLAGSLDVVEAVTTEFTPVMGGHTGPGVVGVAFHPERV